MPMPAVTVEDASGLPRIVAPPPGARDRPRSEEHTSELQSQSNLVCRLLLVKKNTGALLAVFLALAAGKIGEAKTFFQHTGHRADPKRQEGPQAHSIDLSPHKRFAYVDELWLDELLVYRFDGAKGTLTPNDPPYVKLDPGSGPRHFVFAPFC